MAWVALAQLRLPSVQVPHVCVLSIRRFVLWCIMLLQPMAQIGQQALGAGRGILHVYTYLQMVRTYCRTYSSPTEGALPARSCCLFPMLLSFVCWWKRVRDGGGGEAECFVALQELMF